MKRLQRESSGSALLPRLRAADGWLVAGEQPVELVAQDPQGFVGGALTGQDAGAEPGGHGQQAGGLGPGIEPKFPDPLTDDELRRIAVPTLLLTGRHSALIRPARAMACARLMPAAQAEVVGRAGHGPGLEQAHQVNDRILAFLATASSERDPIDQRD